MAASSSISAVTRRLMGKVALITGGASGIGKSTAKLFAQHGAKVVIGDIQDDLGISASENIGPSNCTYIHCNVTDEDDVRNAVDKAVEIHGKLDIMFNNAGVAGVHKPRISDVNKSDFEHILAVNVTGVFLGMKHAARVMVPARTGCIISTASISAIIGGSASHVYTCSKHAVVGLTKNLAIELGQFGIRVNCLSPYGVATPFTKKIAGIEDEQLLESIMDSQANLKGVTLKVEDVAEAALYLASDEARYVSGHNLVIDGGFTIHNGVLKVFEHPPDC